MTGSTSSNWSRLLQTAALAFVLYADQNEATRRPERTWVTTCVLLMLVAAILGVTPTLFSVAALIVASTAIAIGIGQIQRSFR